MYNLHDSNGAVAYLEKCIANINGWMHKNFLKLKNSKTEFLAIISKHNLKYLENVTEIRVSDTTVGYSKSVRNIGAIFDSQLNMMDHVGAIMLLMLSPHQKH